MRFLKISLVATILLVSIPLWAEDSLTLDAAVAQVMATNPDVQAAHLRVDEAKARVVQAIVPPDPQVGVMFEQVPLGTTDVSRGQMTRYQLRQDLPFPTKLYTSGRVAHLDVKVSREENRGKIGDVLVDLKETWFQVYRLDRSLAVNHETQKIVKLLLESAKSRYASGQTTADAPLKAQIELSKLGNEEIGLYQERLTHMSHLKALLNRPTHDDPVLPATITWPALTVDVDELRDVALQRRPELASLAAVKDRERAKLSRARQGLIPDLSIGLEYDKRLGMEDAWTGQLMVNVPIFFWARNRGAMNEAKAAYRASAAEQQSMQIHTGHDIDQAASAVQAAEQQVAIYDEQLLPAAKTTLNVAQVSYAAGKIDFITLMDAARTYKDLQMSKYQTEAQLGTSFARLERLVGETLTGQGGHHD